MRPSTSAAASWSSRTTMLSVVTLKPPHSTAAREAGLASLSDLFLFPATGRHRKSHLKRKTKFRCRRRWRLRLGKTGVVHTLSHRLCFSTNSHLGYDRRLPSIASLIIGLACPDRFHGRPPNN